MSVRSHHWATQPKIPARLDPSAGLRAEFVLLPGFGTDVATGRQWTSAGGSTVLRNDGMRAFDPGGTANALTRAGVTTVAQTKITFVAVINRSGTNAFAEIMVTGSANTGFALGYEADGATVGIVKRGVVGLTGITPASGTVVLIGSHDQTTGDYWIMSRDVGGVSLSAAQNNTAASTASNGTIGINRLGGANAFQDSIFLAIGAFEYKSPAWGRRYLSNPWALFQPMQRRILVAAPAAASTFKAAWARNRNSILGAGARAS